MQQIKMIKIIYFNISYVEVTENSVLSIFSLKIDKEKYGNFAQLAVIFIDEGREKGSPLCKP